MPENHWSHGFDPATWDEACREVRAYLIEVARRTNGEPFASPGSLKSKITAISFDRPPGPKPGMVLAALLRNIDTVEVAAGRPMLSVLVADERRGDRSHGFVLSARRLGRSGGDLEALWLSEVAAVRAFWAGEGTQQSSREE